MTTAVSAASTQTAWSFGPRERVAVTSLDARREAPTAATPGRPPASGRAAAAAASSTPGTTPHRPTPSTLRTLSPVVPADEDAGVAADEDGADGAAAASSSSDASRGGEPPFVFARPGGGPVAWDGTTATWWGLGGDPRATFSRGPTVRWTSTAVPAFAASFGVVPPGGREDPVLCASGVIRPGDAHRHHSAAFATPSSAWVPMPVSPSLTNLTGLYRRRVQQRAGLAALRGMTGLAV